MAKRLIWTDRYNRSLEYIFTCARDIYTIGTLRNLKKGIVHCETLIADNPLMGGVEESLLGMEFEYRHFVLKPYFKIIYRYDEAGEDIYFIDIWDTRRDPLYLRTNL